MCNGCANCRRNFEVVLQVLGKDELGEMARRGEEFKVEAIPAERTPPPRKRRTKAARKRAARL